MALTIRNMTSGDLEFGFALKEQAGWNQTRADFERFLRLAPEGCFLAEWDRRPAGMVMVFEFGLVAWIAMMLVEESLRGQGIGRDLMEHALEFAELRGAVSIRLDATPLGQPLYEKLGFTADYTLTRYGGTAPSAARNADELPRINVDDAVALDRIATGADRQSLLSLLWEEQPGYGIIRDARSLGFHAFRPGSNATQIGPCIAEAPVGPEVFQDALRRAAGDAVFVDVPEPNQLATQLIQAAGLSPRRRLLRMTRGPKTSERVEMLWASSGPEKG